MKPRLPLVFLWLCLLFAGHSRPVPAAPPPPETVRLLTAMPGWYEAATPAQIRRLVNGVSLAGVAAVYQGNMARDAWRKAQGRSADPPCKNRCATLAITPLMRAALETPYPEVIDILVKAGCDVNAVTGPFAGAEQEKPYGYEDAVDRAAVHFAVRNPHPGVLRALLRHKPDLAVLTGDRSRYTALELAAMMPGRAEHFRALVEAASGPDLPVRGQVGLWGLFLGIEADLVGAEGGESLKNPGAILNYGKRLRSRPEEAAARTRALLAKGARPDREALNLALVAGQNEAAKLLLDAGASPGPDRYGNKPLLMAFLRPRFSYTRDAFAISPPDRALIARLIKADSTPETLGAALELACAAGMSADLAGLLVNAGASYTTEGNVLLHSALRSDRDCADLVEYLLSLGFSPNDEGRQGESPLRAARRAPSKPRCALALVKAGADPGVLGISPADTFAVEAGIFDRKGNLLVAASGTSGRDAQRLARERDRLMARAFARPEDALFDPAVYAVATPEEIKRLIGGRSLAGAVRVEHRDDSPSVGTTLALPDALAPLFLFHKLFPRTRTEKYTPLIQAAAVTPHPEVIHALAAAGCNVGDLKSEALFRALVNPNPQVLHAVLSHKPDVRACREPYGTPLHVLAGDLPTGGRMKYQKESFRLLLAAGADPDARFGLDEETPLMKAAFSGNTEAGRLLLAAGADPGLANRVGERAFDMAVSAGAWDLAGDLLKAGGRFAGEQGKSALLNVANGSSPDTPPPAFVRALLAAAGADSAAARNALMAAARTGKREILGILLESRAGRDQAALDGALAAAVMQSGGDDAETVAVLLAKGASPEAKNGKFTVLHYAAAYAHPKQTRALLKAGANVNARGGDNNLDALMLLCLDTRITPQHIATAKALVAAGIDVNAESSSGLTTLQIALSWPELVAVLLKAGAEVDRVNSKGWTALDGAASEPDFAEAVPLLLRAGANPAGLRRRGKSPLQLAQESGNNKAVAYLQAALGKKGR